jgi:hypothetical protein
MFDVADRTGPVVRRNGERVANAQRQHAQSGGGTGGLRGGAQKITAIF